MIDRVIDALPLALPMLFLSCLLLTYWRATRVEREWFNELTGKLSMGGMYKAPPPPKFGAPPNVPWPGSEYYTELMVIKATLETQVHSSIKILDVSEVKETAAQGKTWAVSLRAEGMAKTATVLLTGNDFPYSEALEKIMVFSR